MAGEAAAGGGAAGSDANSTDDEEEEDGLGGVEEGAGRGGILEHYERAAGARLAFE